MWLKTEKIRIKLISGWVKERRREGGIMLPIIDKPFWRQEGKDMLVLTGTFILTKKKSACLAFPESIKVGSVFGSPSLKTGN